MKFKIKARSWAALFVLILLFAVTSAAQKPWKDTAINPHDFSNDYYASNGVEPKSIIGRRTGSDSLSVFGKSSNPNHSIVRVLVTIPGYTQNGDFIFWYPLGEIGESGFTNDAAGAAARENAKLSPMYVFPDRTVAEFYSFTNLRQASLIDDSLAMFAPSDPMNPLGLHEMIFVNYTEKAFSKEGVEMMDYFGKKNGLAVDDTPIIRNLDDIQYLAKNGFITLAAPGGEFYPSVKGPYAIAPIITNPFKGAIAKDAFLWYATKDGRPLVAEEAFVFQFGCLRKTGDFCQ